MKLIAYLLGDNNSRDLQVSRNGQRQPGSASLIELIEQPGLQVGSIHYRPFLLPSTVMGVNLRILSEISSISAFPLTDSTMVCSIEGKPLQPFFVVEDSQAESTIFEPLLPVITVTAFSDDGRILIQKHEYPRQAYAKVDWLLITTKLWEGRLNELPDTFEKFRPAAKLAQRKSTSSFRQKEILHYA